MLQYSSELKSKLQAGEHLAQGSEEEVEIRGCSIVAVEMIKRHMNILGAQPVTSAQIDFYLWNFSKSHSDEMEEYPIHRTLTVFY